MEPTFSSKQMRDLATEPGQAYRQLGTENGRAFISLVADIRAAIFASDVPGGPKATKRNGDTFELEWFISDTCTLATVITASANGNDAWRDAHRIRLEAVTLHGELVLNDV